MRQPGSRMRFGNWGPSAGAVTFQPHYDNYARQMQMHQLAKDQALGQYYSKLENGINPAGVRSVDMDGWQNKVQQWQQFGVQHRSSLINPNTDRGRAQTQFMAMYKDLQGDIAKSKAAANTERAIQPLYLDPKKRALTTNNDLELSKKLGASIYDPNHFKEDGVTPISPADFSFNAPPFDEKMQAQTNAALTKGLKLEKTYGKGVVNQQELKDRIPFTLKHSQSNLKVIGDRMADAYKGTPGIQQFYDNYKLTPDEHDAVNKAYKSVYGDNGDDITTDPQKVAQATAIMKNQQSTTGEDIKPWSRPPQVRGLTAAQQDQQNALKWTNDMTNAIKTGNKDEAVRLGELLYSGKGKSAYQGIDQGPLIKNSDLSGLHPKQGFIVSHVDKVWVPDPTDPSKGSYQDHLNKDELDPTDPALPEKVGKIFQNHMGGSQPLQKGLTGQILNPSAPPVSKPAVTPAAPNKDPLGIFPTTN